MPGTGKNRLRLTARPGVLKVSVVTRNELDCGVRRSGRSEELGLVVTELEA